MYTKENKLEIQILAKLFAIQIGFFFSAKPVSRSKVLIKKVIFFRVFLLFYHTFPSSSLFLFTLLVLFFLSPFLVFSVSVFFILAYIKIRIEVSYSARAYTRNARIFLLVLGQLADCRLCIVYITRVSCSMLCLHETTCRIKTILSGEEAWITKGYELEGRGTGVQFQAGKSYFFLTSRPVVGPTRPPVQ